MLSYCVWAICYTVELNILMVLNTRIWTHLFYITFYTNRELKQTVQPLCSSIDDSSKEWIHQHSQMSFEKKKKKITPLQMPMYYVQHMASWGSPK